MSNKLEFGLFDSFGPFEMNEFPTVRDPRREHFSRATSTSPRPMRRLAPRRSPTY
jgi:hypothetical protein